MAHLHVIVENPSQDDDIRKYLGLNLKMLSLCGMGFNLNNDRPIKKSRFMRTLPIFIILIINFIILEVNAIAFILKQHLEKRLITQICCELFTSLLVICKCLRIATAAKSIQTVFDEISVFWSKYKPNRHNRLEVIEAAQQTLNFCKGYIGISTSAAIAFTLPAISNFVYNYFIREERNYTLAYSKRLFLLRYPFEINNAPIFFSILSIELFQAIEAVLYWCTCDTLFVQLTTHTRIQLKILHQDIRALINHEITEDRLRANVVISIRRHQGLLRVCRNIEDIFSPVIFATILFTALNISVNIFEVKRTNAEGNYARTAIHSFMALGLFFQILFYCSFAETLTNETSAIAETVYSCKWAEKNHKLRFYLQMIMMKSQNPFYYTACGFFPIGHEKMASIITTSFSYLMILQNIS